ncbi:MAG: TatD family hydrolase [Desulfobulbaceae bacterium]|uniref:TatD family hydrolase n=1 Tax=Candidatus Desulfatifera sulfidica TaxID=2841691 RepID=A0A8J6N7G0_9BACT|nr:TatD family hydrolase [Candidatus Desulfatifera sulfidica]
MDALFIDSHLHLQNERYQGRQAEVIQRARTKGVGLLYCNGTCEADWAEVLKLAAHHPEVIPFLGIHPWEADRASPNWEKKLYDLLKNEPVGIGEIGLDRRCPVAPQQQEHVFVRQLKMAIELDRPLTIHCLNAWGRLLEILDGLQAKLPPMMIHSFNGSAEIMAQLLKRGAHISFSARLAEQPKLANCCRSIPADRLLLETDSPDQLRRSLCPEAEDGALNEPYLIPRLYRLAATIRGGKHDKLRQQVYNNGTFFAHSLFSRR